jgi:hypothetical protein
LRGGGASAPLTPGYMKIELFSLSGYKEGDMVMWWFGYKNAHAVHMCHFPSKKKKITKEMITLKFSEILMSILPLFNGHFLFNI